MALRLPNTPGNSNIPREQNSPASPLSTT